MPFTLFPHDIPKAKRIFDLVIVLITAVLWIPILIIISILVLIFHGWPIVFSQSRPGYRGRIFTLNKFRSMNNAKDNYGQLLPDEDRLTIFGKIIRATSLDELPELFNVLKGEMSLIGPRPLLPQYLDRYSPEQNRRHDVLPGITGWAQINGRNNVSWEIKFELDVWYVDNWSFKLDLQILWKTIGKVLKRENISEEGNATAREFMGTATTNNSEKV